MLLLDSPVFTPSRGWKIAGEESAERKRGDTHSHQQRCIRRTTTSIWTQSAESSQHWGKAHYR